MFAAAVAAAMTPGASVSSVLAVCLELARDGTREAIQAVCDRAAGHTDTWPPSPPCARRSAPTTRSARDTVSPDWLRGGPAGCTRSRNCRSRWACCSSRRGDYAAAVLGGVNYGRDADSIATMAGAIAGALHGPAAIPGAWAAAVAEGSRIDLAARRHDHGRRDP